MKKQDVDIVLESKSMRALYCIHGTISYGDGPLKQVKSTKGNPPPRECRFRWKLFDFKFADGLPLLGRPLRDTPSPQSSLDLFFKLESLPLKNAGALESSGIIPKSIGSLPTPGWDMTVHETGGGQFEVRAASRVSTRSSPIKRINRKWVWARKSATAVFGFSKGDKVLMFKYV